MRFLSLLLGTVLWVAIPMGYGQVVVNEIMYHPKADPDNGEYVELYNAGSTPVDLSGWRLNDGIEYTFPPGTVIAGGGFLVVCRDEIYIRNHYAMTDSIKTVGNFAPSQLSNNGERILLLDAAGVEMDRVVYSDTSPWPKEADGQGASLELVNPFVDNNNGLYWRASQQPTPGAVNSRYVPDIPPQILSVNRKPQAPTDKDPVTIESRFADLDSLQTVNLAYRINGGDDQTIAMIRRGNAYAVDLPARPNGTAVEYGITATNKSGFSVVAPVGTTEKRYAYLVDNNPVAPGTIVVNEVMYNNPAKADEDLEWVELFNPTAAAVDLSYWMLKNADDDHIFRIPADTRIPAQGYLLIAREKDPSWTVNTITGLNFSLDNAGDAVRLFDPNGRLISGMEYNDNGEWPEGANGEGGSLELLQVSRPAAEANNWAVSANGGTPGRPNARAITDPAYHDYDIVINEIFYHPEDEEYDGNVEKEYVELYNRNAQAVDLGGWYFSRGIEFRFPDQTVIPGNGYLLVCKNTERYPDVPNRIGNFTLQLGDGGEPLALTNRQGVVIDYVKYNDRSPWPIRPDGDGQSLELISPNADNRIAQYWRNGQPASPGKPNSVWVANTPPRIRQVSQIPARPTAIAEEGGTVTEPQVEAKTLLKPGDLWRYFKGKSEPPKNWTALDFDDASWSQGPSGFGYGDNDDATVLNDMQNNYLSVYIRTIFTIDDPTIYTLFAFDMIYDDGFVAYLNGVEIARANVDGTPPPYNQQTPSTVEPTELTVDISKQIGLLKKGNNVLAIQIHNVNLTSTDLSAIPSLAIGRVIQPPPPTEPKEDADIVLITAKVEDEDSVGEVDLNYQRLSAPLGAGLVLGDWKTVRMTDDGAAGDAVAGDSIYTFRLNDAEKLRPREIWRYRITAKDRLGNETVLPYQDELTKNYAFFVAQRDEKPTYPIFDVFMERATLDFLTRNPDTNVEQHCIVVIDGVVYDLYDAGGIRYLGANSSDTPVKSWKISFPKGNRWRDCRTVNLKANYQTSALLRGECGFLEHLAFGVFRELGVPAANTEHWRLGINNTYYGLFLLEELYNEDFLAAHHLPVETRIFKTGNGDRRSALTVEPGVADYAKKYENSTGRKGDIADLVRFIEDLNSAQDLKAFFEANLYIDAFIDYLVGEALVSQVDGVEKNYFPTHAADGRWWIMPWDITHAWGEIQTNSQFPLVSNFSLLDGAEGGVFGTNVLRQKFLSVPDYRQRYYERLRYDAEHVFTHEHLDPIFDSYWAYLKDAIAENTARWNSPGRLSEMAAELKKYVTARRDFILKDPQVRPANTPTTPTNLSPKEGSSIAARALTLEAAMNAQSQPVESQWEIQAAKVDFFQPTWAGTKTAGTLTTIEVPPGALASNTKYFWRARYKTANGLWSDWSSSTSFTTQDRLPPPDVQNVVVTAFDGSVRLEWTQPAATDLIRVDIYDGSAIVESVAGSDNRVHIRDLKNGKEYLFTIRTVTFDRRVSSGVMVKAMPVGPLGNKELIAYFRFEGDTSDFGGLFAGGLLLGSADISAPGSEDPVPLNKAINTASLNLKGLSGNGFVFGRQEPYLNVKNQLTLECYAQLSAASSEPVTLLDRYNEIQADSEGIWRWGMNFSGPRSLDFFFNDGGAKSGYAGRMQVSSREGAVPADGKFHHYAVVVDLTSRLYSEKVRLYIDGKPVSAQIVNDDGESNYNTFRDESRVPVTVGAKGTAYGTAEVLPGRIDEVRLTAGILSPQEFLHPSTLPPGISDWSMF